MGSYYNKARGPRSMTLRDGSTAHFAAKKWTHVEKNLEGSAELMRAVRKGALVYRADPAPAPVKELQPVKPASRPAVKAASKAKASDDTVAKKKSKKSTRKNKG